MFFSSHASVNFNINLIQSQSSTEISLLGIKYSICDLLCGVVCRACGALLRYMRMI